MSHALLQGHWKNKSHNVIIQCYQTTNQLFVKLSNDDQEIINGSYYPVSDGFLITFYVMQNNTIKSYNGKLFNTKPEVLYLETIATISRPMEHYRQDLWSLYDDCDHENIILTKNT